MNDRRPSAMSRVSAPALLATLLALAVVGCKSTSESKSDTSKASQRVDLSAEITSKTVVVAVDPTQKLLTLRREDGSVLAVTAGPDVRNFNQIAVGDTLRVRYQESLSATLRPAGECATPVEGGFVAGRAKPGEKPAGGLGMGASARVKIESVDAANGIVVFSSHSGELRTVRATRPEGRAFVDGLKVGDTVQLDYTESIAVAIDEM